MIVFRVSVTERECVCVGGWVGESVSVNREKLGRSWAQHPCVLMWMNYWVGRLEPTRTGKAHAKCKGEASKKPHPPDAEPAHPIEDPPADDG